MQVLKQYGLRTAITLLPLLFAVLHAVGVLPLGVLQRLDNIIYDTRLRATMPLTQEQRVVIVDIDEKSLAEVGRWPWPRNQLADLVDTLFDQQGISLLGFDTVFAETDDSSGLKHLQWLAQTDLADQPVFAQRLADIAPQLDHDARFARSLKQRPVVLGYYFTSDREGRSSGTLPAPVMRAAALGGRTVRSADWNGHGGNIAPLAAAAPQAGFINSVPGSDGVVRSLPLLAQYRGDYYESLALAMFRMLAGLPRVEPGFPPGRFLPDDYGALENLRLSRHGSHLDIPVDDTLSALVPFRGPGGPQGGSFRYVSASDLLAGRLPPGTLQNKIVLLGTTAPGLQDLRVTPLSEAYPGVETHANLLAGLLDGQLATRPDYAVGYELIVLLVSGLLLALVLPRLSAVAAVGFSALVVAAVLGLNSWLYLAHGLVLPLASALVTAGLAYALNMSYGYLVESRAKRELAHLFGTYVPPELVEEMVKDPDAYGMAATTRELTVMFCDMRGFTHISEAMPPTELQSLLNTLFSHLTRIIRHQRGTIDKYMGDCVMAFWGAPVYTPEHARLSVQAALDMSDALRALNRERSAAGLSAISVGVGINTGDMCVGDMGSDVRRSYTVVGDAVNLGARLESLSREYGVDIVASETTRRQAPGFVWQELDKVRVKGKAHAVSIHTPLCPADRIPPGLEEELQEWQKALDAWRARNWVACAQHLVTLERLNANYYLYRLYAQRVAFMRNYSPPPDWDGSTTFDAK